MQSFCSFYIYIAFRFKSLKINLKNTPDDAYSNFFVYFYLFVFYYIIYFIVFFIIIKFF